MSAFSCLGLGSNLGDRLALLDFAVSALSETQGIEVCAISSYRETMPVGGPAGQGAFLNAAATLRTTLDPHDLLRCLQAIETDCGRLRSVRWGERTLDLDLLTYDTKFLWTPGLIVPHPLMAVRRFVLAPLAEIAPDVVHSPTGLSVASLLARLDRKPGHLALVGPSGHLKAEVFARLKEVLDPKDWTLSLQDHGVEPKSEANAPTFGLVVDPAQTMVPQPWQANFPLLWPDSNQPEAILAEALAACLASKCCGDSPRTVQQ